MTDKEIIQALRCCAKGLGHDDACENCKVGEIQDRREYIEFAAANVIERLTAENAALREKAYSMSGEWCAMMSVLNSIGSYDRLRELAEADKDGRVVVLPCKVWDTVWRIVRDGEPHITRDEVRDMYFADDMTPCVELVGGRVTFIEKFGKTVFLTREEAEKALQEMEGKKDG